MENVDSKCKSLCALCASSVSFALKNMHSKNRFQIGKNFFFNTDDTEVAQRTRWSWFLSTKIISHAYISFVCITNVTYLFSVIPSISEQLT